MTRGDAAPPRTRAIDPRVRALVAHAKAGDPEAFARLYDRYLPVVYGYLYGRVRHRQTVEDLTADVFLRALRNLDRFAWQGVDFGAWLLTIARNRVTDHYKSARVRLEHVTDDVIDQATDDGDPERTSADHEVARDLRGALLRLKDEHREVIELRFMADLSVAETAAVMHRSVGATKALQYRALKALAATLESTPHLRHLTTTGLGGLVALLRVLGGG